jgi:hypothetical protein
MKEEYGRYLEHGLWPLILLEMILTVGHKPTT